MNSFRKLGRHRSDQKDGDDEGDTDSRPIHSDQLIFTPGKKNPIPDLPLPETLLSSPSRPSLVSTQHSWISEDSSIGSRQVHPHRRSPSPSVDPLGLSLIHESSEAVVDFVFVHGLGGSSRRSWSWKHNPQCFWPIWLKDDVNLSQSRLFTFGYNADFTGHQTPLSILDFAKDLLFRLKTYASIKSSNVQPIGQHPIVFVMHSLGGLVVKMACIIGRSDLQYSSIVSLIVGMLFLGTPHHGSDLAETLSHILRSTPGLSSKKYVSELERGSGSLQIINDQFRTVCAHVDLVSLYETRKTGLLLGIRKLIVQKESAILGYPTEQSGGLDADHHNMSKFADSSDTNFLHVRNILNMFLQKVRANAPEIVLNMTQAHKSPMKAKKQLEDLFGIYEDPANDLEIVRDQIMPESCQWILCRKAFQTWTNLSDRNSRILWLTGLPGVGKSTLSGFIIEHLRNNPLVLHCHYHFFKSEHQSKRSVGHMLRSIAFQLATVSETFRERFLELYDVAGMSFEGENLNTIWKAIYGTILSRQPFSQSIFWVLYGLDEADQPELLIRLLSKLDSTITFRVLIVSRIIRDLTSHLGKNINFVQEQITTTDTIDDIRSYASSVISTIVHTEKGQEELCKKICARAHSSFLWVKLVLDQLRDNWHTHNDVDRILNDTPEGMEQLYVRMTNIISEQAPRPKSIALRILTWVVCTFRPLEIAQLKTVLEPEFGEFVNLSETVARICANFVVVEKSRVFLIHDTARHFLLHKTVGLSITIDSCLGHEYLATTCMRFLMDPKRKWRRVLSLAQTKTLSLSSGLQIRPMRSTEAHPFLAYAAIWWAYHVSLAATSEALMTLVLEFLESTCLIWINAVALLGEMRDLTRAAQYLKLFMRRKSKETSHQPLTGHYQSRDDDWRQWTKDLIRVVGRFGNTLMQSPQAIYGYVIPFCPTESIIRRTYTQSSAFSVTGISSAGWDDCMARLTMENDECATKILCMGSYFVTLVGSGTMIVWHADSCAEARRLRHQEWVTVMEACRDLYWIATAGTKTIRIWDINLGEEVFCIPKLSSRRILALSFGKHNDELRIGYDDSTIQCYTLPTLMEKWRMVAEDSSNHDHACPHLVSFSPDGCQVLLGYHGKPIFAWSLDSQGQLPQKYVRPEDKFGRHQDFWRAGTPDCVEWLPERPIVFIIYNDTTLIEWNIEDESQRELPVLGAREMTISSDGNLLLTSDYTGTLSVWAVPEFRLTYRLQMEEPVHGLAFSPDRQRLYDIRGCYCNVWEPDSLVRPDHLNKDKLSGPQNTDPSEHLSSTGEVRPQITTLIADQVNELYCCGKDSGAVVLYEIKTGGKIRRLYGHSTVASITQLAWSTSKMFVASADDCGRVLVKRLKPPTVQKASWAVYGLLDFRPGESVTQLLFDSSEEFLLVATSSYDTVWSLKHKTEMCHTNTRAGKTSKWINHPTDPETLILLNPHGIRIFHFPSLKEKDYLEMQSIHEDGGDAVKQSLDSKISSSLQQLNLSRSASDSDPPELLGRAVALDQSRIIFETFPGTGTEAMVLSRRCVTLLVLSPSHSHTLQQLPALTGKYYRIIGTFHNNLVFLDRDHAFCTLHLDHDRYNDVIKKHFYLPKDWLTPEMLALCIINQFGTILCPKNGEVAVIQDGIRVQ